MKRYIYILIVALAIMFGNTGCKKLIQVGTPDNQLTSDKVFTDSTATGAAMVNIYAQFNKTIDPNFNRYFGLYTDELIYPTSTSDEFYLSNLSVGNSIVLNIWKNNYFVIYSCNDLISQMQLSSTLPAALQSRFTAEAKFLRAYAYFNLVTPFNRIPLLLTADVNETHNARQSDSASVYHQIVEDLKSAQNALPATYIGTGKIRANKYAAEALLSRVYLFQQDWPNAETTATEIINSGLYTPLETPAKVFLANSTETILQFGTQNGFIADAPTLIPSGGAPQYPVTASLLNDFENGDLRKSSWLKSVTVGSTTYYYPYKYHNRASNTAAPENLMALRAAEVYLIRAEARAQQGDINGAVQDLNVIRQRAGLTPPLSSTISKQECLNAVMKEWRTEFFMEWGHRYFDLKRTGRLNAVMSALKTSWSSKSILFPIPQNEITFDSNLLQNPNY